MYPESLQQLIEAFRTLPGVGEKTAERYALTIAAENEEILLEMDYEDMTIYWIYGDVKEKLKYCRICGNFSEDEECSICKDASRNHKQIFVVQSPKDVLVMEKTGQYHGVYHVLNGLISASKGILPDDLNIPSLMERLPEAEEVILATDATMDGETTAMYLSKKIHESFPSLLVTRIAHGLPAGGALDYADELTLSHALSDRRRIG